MSIGKILPTALLLLSVPFAIHAQGMGNPGQGGDNGPRHEMRDENRPANPGAQADFRFSKSDHRAVVDYYGPQFRSGRCPPGLARKGKNCTPPGQARKWQMGHPLPRDVATYPLPKDLLVRLPAPPAGHEYVRVANDILMIMTGTAMVVDAIQDIGR